MAKVTSTDVAKLAMVSQSTVSFVFNNRTDISISQSTRTRVIEAAKKLGYGPFSSTSAFFISDLVAVIAPSFDNPYYSAVLGLISKELSGKNIKMLVYCTDKSKEKEIQALTSANIPSVFSIIYLYTPIAKKEAIKIAKQKKTFIFGEVDYEINANIITLSSKHAGYIAAQHLYNLGHRNIAYISNPIEELSISRKKRLEGIMDFAKEVGIDKNIITYIVPKENADTSELITGYNAAKLLLEKNKNISAIIGMNDYTALGILNALYDMHINCPQEISVMGFDNLALSAAFHPSLTTVDHLINERIHHTIELLTSENTKSQYIHITYDPKLIARDSTGPSPKTIAKPQLTKNDPLKSK